MPDGAKAAATSGPLDGSVRQAITQMLATARVPGCAIAATTRSGAIATLFFGNARLDPRQEVTARTRFHLFSGTKLYTAAAVMVLVDRGAIELDQPIATYLPTLGLSRPVTLRQLAAHDSGLPDTLRAFLSVHRGEAAGPSSAEALARYRLAGGRTPGRGAAYRNVNYALLGELVSAVAGEPYESFVERSLLEPLGARLQFGHTAESEAITAAGHIPRWSPMRLFLRFLLPGVSRWIEAQPVDGFVPLRPFALDTAAIGGLVGPAEAFLPMLREMANPADGVLSAGSKRSMLTLQSRGAAGIVSREGVGLGWKFGRVGAIEFWNHEGGGPGFCSETRLYPDHDLGIVVLMNRSQSRALSRLCHRICERIREAIAG